MLYSNQVTKQGSPEEKYLRREGKGRKGKIRDEIK